MGQLVGELAREYDCEVAGIVDPHVGRQHAARSTIRAGTTSTWRSTSRRRTRSMTTCRRWPGGGINVVLGTTGWQAHEAELRKAVADAGSGIVAAPNFSTGVVLFEAIVAQAATALGRPGRIWRLAARGASRAKEGRAVGHRAQAEAGDGRSRVSSADRRGGLAGRLHSGHAHDWFRRTVGIDYADAYGARPRRLRARRADGGAVGQGPARAGSRCKTCWG